MLKLWRNFPSRSLDFCKLSIRTMSTRLDLFQSIGLSEQKAKETLKNEALAKHLEDVVTAVSTIDVRDCFAFYYDVTWLISKMLHIVVN